LSLKNQNLITAVSQIYYWLDNQTYDLGLMTPDLCNACGNCCDFDSYGHRLYITPPELIYFESKMGTLKLVPASERGSKIEWTGRCPYQADNKCSVHPHRFASCRIFFCRGNADKQSELSEETLKKLKALCVEFDIPYRYMDLKNALNESL
jgi:Fe-S-cluster containining protein